MQPAQQETTWPAPAKLNLMLRVTGRRADGYHELQTVFQLLDFGDEIKIQITESGVIRSLSPIAGVDDQNDLTLRAARLLQTHSGVTQGAIIAVKKNLPMGAGLGGGSSNAATVLVALNYLWQLDLSTDKLAELGLALGADVPVFVHGRSAWAEGVGEHLLPIELPIRWYLVVWPGVQIATAKVFADPQLTRNCPAITIRDFLADGLRQGVDNVFQAVVLQHYPAVANALSWLCAQCKDVTSSIGMTGTGSCVFAAFDDEYTARNMLDDVPRQWAGFVAKGVNYSPLNTSI